MMMKSQRKWGRTMTKKIKVLIMSVGPCQKNTTAKWFEKIGGVEHCVACLPKQFEEFASSYLNRGFEVFIYDEKKYIGKEVEYFGFKPRNCGGIGRQGIAEAVDKFGDEYICFQIDDDTSQIAVRTTDNYGNYKAIGITKWKNFEKLVLAQQEFYELTGIECMSQTGASIPKVGDFICNHKIFNNFIMRKGNRLNYDGFKALCSDDYRYNIYNNLLRQTPMITTNYSTITFNQNQGDREDGNAVLYNSDCSWKKSYGLKMIMPVCIAQRISKEQNRILFRENLMASKLYPPICLEENGKIIGRA